MSRIDVRPSKPYAVLMALVAVGILIFGAVQVIGSGAFEWSFLIFPAAGLFVIGAALWQAFGRGDSAVRRDRTLVVAGAIAGVGILIFGGFQLAGTASPVEIALIGVAGLAIIGYNLWSVFSRRD
ncbi:MAG TPA: hypothetical protein VN408_43070 [Actinoplanes sp.]|nr:hypothetical protein [Actinoplanes sp.]